MKISLELFEDCGGFDRMMEVKREDKQLCWQLCIDDEPIGDLINYDQGFMDTLNILFELEGRFKLTKITKNKL